MDAVEVFNSLPAERLEADLLACCAAPAWGAAVLAGRPYPDRSALLAGAEDAVRALAWPDLLAAILAHPRIGERPAGDSQEAAWSRQEQSVAGEGGDALLEANLAYERRFGHVFLIFASGRSQEEIVAAAAERVRNDDEAERVVIAGELGKIAALRLGRVLDALG